MNEKINITYADGRQIQADLICFIENVANNKRYVYFTLNETVGTGTSSTVKIYVGNIKLNNPALDTPIAEDEWGVLKGFMGDALKDNANPNVKYIPLTEIGQNVNIISDRAIAMPISYDYINKQRGTYATAVAGAETGESAETPAAEPSPIIEPTPVVNPEPVEPPVPEPTPVTPIVPEPVEAVPTPTETPAPAEPPVTEESAPADDDTTSGSALQLEPIDISSIETKYAEMIADIEKLKNREIEAAKRYNATIELSQMHNEQHASYVQSEVQKEIPTAPIQETPIVPVADAAPTANPVPVAGTPVIPTAAPVPEPTPVTPTVPEPAPATSETSIETNWFDMPAA